MKKVVMCFGTFDGLHPGHEDFFRQSKECGEELIVIVSRDITVVDVKGNLPANNENDRLNVVREHPLVDDARLGNHGDKYHIIEEVNPDIICLGYDQETFTENLDAELARRGLSATIVRCEPFFPDQFKSTLLRGMREEVDTSEEAEYEENGLPL
jgi:FAD synthetase